MVNIPLSDTFALRGTGYYRDNGGFVDSIGTAGSDVEDDINDSESYGGRVSALLEPERCVLVAADRGPAEHQHRTRPAPSRATPRPSTLCMARCRNRSSCRTFNDVDYRLYNATLDFDLGFATLTSSTSYNELDSPFHTDVTLLLSAADRAHSSGRTNSSRSRRPKYDKVTQELRLASPRAIRSSGWSAPTTRRRRATSCSTFAAVTPERTTDPHAATVLPVFGDTSAT